MTKEKKVEEPKVVAKPVEEKPKPKKKTVKKKVEKKLGRLKTGRTTMQVTYLGKKSVNGNELNEVHLENGTTYLMNNDDIARLYKE